MVIEKMLKYLLFLSGISLLPIHAFWWAPPVATTTTHSDCSSESPPLTLKQVPLTYFRTYTYQPLAGNPFAAFPYYHHTASALQSPLLAGPTRYEQAAYMPGGGYPVSLALQQQHQHQQQQTSVGVAYQLPQHPVLHTKPLPSPTTTTSTTTKKPTTTSTTTTTTTTTTPSPPSTTASSTRSTTTSSSLSSGFIQNLPIYDSAPTHLHPSPYPYPTYNRRAYMGYNSPYYRAAYPYPDYSIYKTGSSTRFSSHGEPIQFVPCMCPVSVAAPGVESNAALSLQGRTTGGGDDDLMVLERTEDVNVPDKQRVVDEEGERKTDVAAGARIVVETQVGGKVEAESELLPKLQLEMTTTSQEEAVMATHETEGQKVV